MRFGECLANYEPDIPTLNVKTEPCFFRVIYFCTLYQACTNFRTARPMILRVSHRKVHLSLKSHSGRINKRENLKYNTDQGFVLM